MCSTYILSTDCTSLTCLPSLKRLNQGDIPRPSPSQYSTTNLSHNHHLCFQLPPKCFNPMNYVGFKSIQVTHTNSVSQSLPSSVYVHSICGQTDTKNTRISGSDVCPKVTVKVSTMRVLFYSRCIRSCHPSPLLDPSLVLLSPHST